MSSTELVRKASIEELCGHRNRAIELYQTAARMLIEAQKAHRRALVGQSYASGYPYNSLRYISEEKDVVRFGEDCQKLIDIDMWRAFIVGTKLGGLMDAQERKRFEDSLTGHNAQVPEATPENVEATLNRLAGEAGTIFRRGLVTVFRSLSKEYRSHGGFKIEDRIILGYCFNQPWNGRVGSFTRDAQVRDADRVMHVLDGKPAPSEHNEGLCGAIRAANDKGIQSCETEYWRAKWYLNRNMHLWPKRPDLVRLANQIIAEECGPVLPEENAA